MPPDQKRVGLMDNLRLGIMALFNTGGAFNTAVNGRLFFGDAPEGTNLQDGSYAIFFFVSDTNDDVFAGQGKEVYVQFSLFSGDSSPAVILAMDTHLTTMFKDKIFPVSGWTVVVMKRVQGSGPINVPADVDAGTGRYWQFDIDYVISIEA